MVLPSSYITQQIAGQNAYFSGQAAYAQQLSYPMMSALQPGMAPPPPAPPPMSLMSAPQYAGGTAVYGEQMAASMAGAGRMGMTVGGAALGIGASLLSPIPLDPFSGAIGGAFRGGVGGAVRGGLLGGAVGLPFYAGAAAVGAYGDAFFGGMNQQASINSTLRNNFQFSGGQGPMGRGFNQSQMGQIGATLANELRQNPFTNTSELNSVIAGGADMGMFTAVREVKTFTDSFRKMLDTLKSVQKELGGTLTDALRFMKTSQQAGIFQDPDVTKFATALRGTEAVSGLNRDQLMGLSIQGSQIARAVGGVGRQGAMGALRSASVLGAAIQSGAISQELLSEATGGLTGADAVQAFTGRMMQQTARFSRTAAGRYSLFALSNENATGLDEGMLARFAAGDTSVGEIRQRAHKNVSQMGRARAINREGLLRGAVLEQGGMGAQIGIMRQQIVDRLLEQNDDLVELVLQRRHGMTREEARVNLSLIRNQSNIAGQETMDRMAATRQQAISTDTSMNKSFDALFRNLEHGLNDTMKLNEVRAAGRGFVTKISSMVEKTINDFLGVASNALTNQDSAALNRTMTGRATRADERRLRTNIPGLSGGEEVDTSGFFKHSGSQDVLRALGFHGGENIADKMKARGIDLSGLSPRNQLKNVQLMVQAGQGLLSEKRDLSDYGELMKQEDYVSRELVRAKVAMKEGGIHDEDFHSILPKFLRDKSPRALEAFAARKGLPKLGAIGLGEMLAGLRSGSGDSETTSRNAAEFIARGGHMRGRRLDTEAVSSFVSTEKFRDRLTQLMDAGGDKDKVNTIFTEMQRAAIGPGIDAKTSEAQLGVIDQMRSSMMKNRGKLGSEFFRATFSEDRLAQIKQERLLSANEFSSMATKLDGLGAHGVAGTMNKLSEALAGGGDFVNEQNEMRAMLARSSPEMYERMAKELGQSDMGRGLLQQRASDAEFMRGFMGKGRRGPRQSAETGINAITGGLFSDMSISIGGRELRGQNRAGIIQELVRRGGKGGDEALKQIVTQLGEQGVQGADEMVQQYKDIFADKKITSREAFDLKVASDEFRAKNKDAFGKVADDKLRASDPLGAEQRDLLREIRDRLPDPKVATETADAAKKTAAAAQKTAQNTEQNQSLPPGDGG